MEDEKTAVYDLSGLKLCLIGMIMAFINIRIRGFDLVPDIIGYLLVIVGLGRLEHYDDSFSAAKKAACVLAVLSLFNIVQIQDNSSSGSVIFDAGVFGNTPWIGMVMMIAGVLANLCFTFFLCMGMQHLLQQAGEDYLAKTCKERWEMILITQIGLMLSLLLAFLGLNPASVAAIAFAILAFAAGGLLLILVYNTWQRIDGKEILIP